MYTVKKCTLQNLVQSDLDFIIAAAEHLNVTLNVKYNYRNFDLFKFVKDQHLWMCYRNDEPVGFLAATLFKNFFDSETICIKQNILFSLPNTRGAHLLFHEFVDFGKRHANHILTAIGKSTNIKPSSLERHGFKKLEELYRLEIS